MDTLLLKCKKKIVDVAILFEIVFFKFNYD